MTLSSNDDDDDKEESEIYIKVKPKEPFILLTSPSNATDIILTDYHRLLFWADKLSRIKRFSSF